MKTPWRPLTSYTELTATVHLVDPRHVYVNEPHKGSTYTVEIPKSPPAK